ncbi:MULTISPECIES: cytochrome P450 [unclassified Streptomyces]|uniref:cytochrome P450 n=1 Tax=unclassified Streptomyces TaxID=2593676 RepID=UPI002E8224FB|nr:cytochrome P450 [Streptomyces sp. NBC_00589]WTI34125.1 cytochrome P450 [Streptomyces sp. NBC_00775]WUB32202.1 cytochrome P450 [Streptomyces sp. NBC_00589]
MLSMLLQAEDEGSGKPLTGHQICSEILTLAVAGTETTASVLSWVMYELARNPGIDERVQAELDEVVADRPVTFDDLPHLPYLGRVITEALRLHHTGWLVTRRTLRTTRIGAWEIPAAPGQSIRPVARATVRPSTLQMTARPRERTRRSSHATGG